MGLPHERHILESRHYATLTSLRHIGGRDQHRRDDDFNAATGKRN
ncbi:hypothetical protein [Natronospirillum sp.]|nr:hypothetical protein [Natronospirillum sp.]